MLVQTPQVFTAELIKAALISSLTQGKAVTDDCAAVELFGKPVLIVAGDYANIKITTVEDLAIAQYMMESRVKQ